MKNPTTLKTDFFRVQPNFVLHRETDGPVWIILSGGYVATLNIRKETSVSWCETNTKLEIELDHPVAKANVGLADILVLPLERHPKLTAIKRHKLSSLLSQVEFKSFNDTKLGLIKESITLQINTNKVTITLPPGDAGKPIWQQAPPLPSERADYVDWYVRNVVLRRQKQISPRILSEFTIYADQYLTRDASKTLQQILDTRYKKLLEEFKKLKLNKDTVIEWVKTGARISWWQTYIKNSKKENIKDLAWFDAIEPHHQKSSTLDEACKALAKPIGRL